LGGRRGIDLCPFIGFEAFCHAPRAAHWPFSFFRRHQLSCLLGVRWGAVIVESLSLGFPYLLSIYSFRDDILVIPFLFFPSDLSLSPRPFFFL